MKQQYNIKKLYLYNLCHSLIFAYVIERLFWESRGISIQQVVYIEIIYSIGVILLELPTGMFADRFSRKTLVVIDALLSLLEIGIIIYAQSFWHFALAIMLSAMGHALQSGAHNGLIYDTLQAEGRVHQFEKVLGRIKAIDYTGSMINGVFGAIVANHYQYVTTYWLSLGSLIVAFFVAISLHEVSTHEKKAKVRPWSKSDWLIIYEFMIKKDNIRYVVFIGTMSGSALVFLEEFWQIHVRAVHIPVAYFGIINILGFGGVTIGSLLAIQLRNRWGFQKVIWMTMVICAVGYLGMAMIHKWYAIGMMVLIYVAGAVMEPLVYGFLHHEAMEKYRATTESAYSLMVRLGIMIIGLPFGWLSTAYSVFIGFLYLGVLLVTMTIIAILGRRQW